MEKNKFYYIIPSIIITALTMFLIFSSRTENLKESLSAKDSYIDELKNTIQEQRNDIKHLQEENEHLNSEISDLEEQEDTSELLEVKIDE